MSGTNGHSSNGQHSRADRFHPAPPLPLSGWRATLRGLPVSPPCRRRSTPMRLLATL